MSHVKPINEETRERDEEQDRKNAETRAELPVYIAAERGDERARAVLKPSAFDHDMPRQPVPEFRNTNSIDKGDALTVTSGQPSSATEDTDDTV